MNRRLLPIVLPLAVLFVATPVAAQSPEPSLPTPITPGPVIEQVVDEPQPALVVRKQVARPMRSHRIVRNHVPRDLDRPALAGVELVAPLPLPGEPPHITVPMPAYPLDSLVTAYTTPPPPIICHRARRDPDAPDPRLYREVPVVCEPDNP